MIKAVPFMPIMSRQRIMRPDTVYNPNTALVIAEEAARGIVVVTMVLERLNSIYER
jgi:hypothetical protein